ncbi:hypothetical protein DPMN_053794 [Dreissena polymorpha]|uniref:Uncharacterized protein n=1 Tax=Dreissena polymorpha TaxID=45954 RepID=A0A9D4CM14_DREPO|nr:hypothetical protein DPMN_053794 [Dreissena polymorpha]
MTLTRFKSIVDNLPKRADGLFELCNKMFEHVEAMLRKEEDEEVDAAEGDDKRVTKTLLNHFSTPCTSIIQTELNNSN